AVADPVTVGHRLGNRHRQAGTTRRDLIQPHAELTAGPIPFPQRPGARAPQIVPVWVRGDARPPHPDPRPDPLVIAGLDPAVIGAVRIPAHAFPKTLAHLRHSRRCDRLHLAAPAPGRAAQSTHWSRWLRTCASSPPAPRLVASPDAPPASRL